MKEGEPEDYHGMLDDDPALDFSLYREMEKEDRRHTPEKGGCLSLAMFLSVSSAAFCYLFDLIA